MFNSDFYPTPEAVIFQMMEGENVEGKTILEPSAGSGNIIDWLKNAGAGNILACEIDPRLKHIAAAKGKLIAEDFLTVTSDQVSHVHFIVMNPPFSKGAEHVNHAFNIAPAGCKIIALTNWSTYASPYGEARNQFKKTIEENGTAVKLTDAFKDAERRTNVEVALIKIQKPANDYSQEFSGFFLEEEEEASTGAGLMEYNAVRDIVNRYVAAVKIYDKQLATGIEMSQALGGHFGRDLAFTMSEVRMPAARNEFKKDLQKAGWRWVFSKLNLEKYSTRTLREDINKFVEQQSEIPFTMRNIYHMLQIVVGTTGQRMDKAIVEAFDNITEHHADNRHHVKGWKTNSHFLVGKKFILPNCVSPAKEYGYTSDSYNYLGSSKSETIADLEKALCYVLGVPYTWEQRNEITGRNEFVTIPTIAKGINRNKYGEWYDNSSFFKYKAFKNGNMHFEFKDEEVWLKFNQRVGKIKGYPLFEGKQQTAYQQRQTGRAQQQKARPQAKEYQPQVLFEMDI